MCVDQQPLGDVKSFNRFQYLEILAAGLDKKESKFHDTDTLKHPNWSLLLTISDIGS